MHIRVLPSQIPIIWDVIKFVVKSVYKLEKDYDFIFIMALHELFNDKYQCFVHLSDDGKRTIKAMLFTEVCVDKFSGKRWLGIPCLYSFTYHEMKEWDEFFEIIIKYAKQAECWPIRCESGNARVWEICEYLGFNESSRNFTYNKGGE